MRSWEEAVRFAQAELKAAGDLEGRLEGYARTASNLSEKIDLLDQARPALELIGQLRELQVPLMGNGWQILLALLSLATVDGAKIIAKLEETLGKLTELKDSLDNLSGLEAVADAGRAFRADPSRGTLAALSTTSAAATPSLLRLQADLSPVLDGVEDIAGKLNGLVGGLRGVAGVDIPVISDAARHAAERIGLIEDPMLSLRDGLNQLHQNIKADVVVLETIQEAVRQAREHEE